MDTTHDDSDADLFPAPLPLVRGDQVQCSVCGRIIPEYQAVHAHCLRSVCPPCTAVVPCQVCDHHESLRAHDARTPCFGFRRLCTVCATRLRALNELQRRHIHRELELVGIPSDVTRMIVMPGLRTPLETYGECDDDRLPARFESPTRRRNLTRFYDGLTGSSDPRRNEVSNE